MTAENLDIHLHPGRETIVGLAQELAAFVSGRVPHTVDPSTPLRALGIDGQRMAMLLGAVQQCFDVVIPPPPVGEETTVGELAERIGGSVHDAVRVQMPIRRERAEATPAKRLLFIGGAAVPEFERAAARRGCHASLFTYHDGEMGPGPRAGTTGVIDHIQAVDWSQPFDVLRRVVDLHRRGEIDRVVPDDEFGLLPAALAAGQLGVPGPSLDAVRNTRDKVHMRRTLERAGLGQVQYAVCREPREAEAFLERVGGPVILKPVSGTGSEGVSRVSSADDIPAAFALASGAAGFMGVLCEEYVEGPEVSLEGYSVDGTFVPVTLTDKLTDERFLEIGHQQPSTQPQNVFDAAADLAGRVLRALGIMNGVSHTELRITSRGPVLIETHTRMGGGHLHVLTRLSTGVDLADAVVAFSVGERVTARPEPQGRAAAIRYILGRPGRVRSVFMPPREEFEGVHAILGPQPGRVLTGLSSSRERLGHVIATGDTCARAGRAAEDYIAGIRIEYFD